MVRTFAAVLALLAASLLSLPAEAQWKWRDKSGHTQYSDLPPPAGTPEQDILLKPGNQKDRVSVIQTTPASGVAVAASGAASGALTPRVVEPELEAKRKKQEADAAAKVKADEARVAAARADNCTRAKGQMATLDSGIRIARSNEKGEREILDDRQRAAEVKRARDAIASDCK
ncbi:MAG: DUF4124 domain-containing protein [Caldimonas sp.]